MKSEYIENSPKEIGRSILNNVNRMQANKIINTHQENMDSYF